MYTTEATYAGYLTYQPARFLLWDISSTVAPNGSVLIFQLVALDKKFPILVITTNLKALLFTAIFIKLIFTEHQEGLFINISYQPWNVNRAADLSSTDEVAMIKCWVV